MPSRHLLPVRASSSSSMRRSKSRKSSGTGSWATSSYMRRSSRPIALWRARIARAFSVGFSSFDTVFPIAAHVLHATPRGCQYSLAAVLRPMHSLPRVPNAPPPWKVPARQGTFWAGMNFQSCALILPRRSLFMSISQTLAPHLPYLRRYARALTGSQASAGRPCPRRPDGASGGRSSLTEGVPPRVGLYRLFHAIWQSGAEHYDEAAMPPARQKPGKPPARAVRLQARGPASDRGGGFQPRGSRLHRG